MQKPSHPPRFKCPASEEPAARAVGPGHDAVHEALQHGALLAAADTLAVHLRPVLHDQGVPVHHDPAGVKELTAYGGHVDNLSPLAVMPHQLRHLPRGPVVVAELGRRHLHLELALGELRDPALVADGVLQDLYRSIKAAIEVQVLLKRTRDGALSATTWRFHAMNDGHRSPHQLLQNWYDVEGSQRGSHALVTRALTVGQLAPELYSQWIFEKSCEVRLPDFTSLVKMLRSDLPLFS
mmetsp:Transcript_58581/g.171435  ORF Transcript_58581/g.171435 Transcript_58581/m.171435 type:complete len:238 (+) Transcript_58581:82-795(+)